MDRNFLKKMIRHFTDGNKGAIIERPKILISNGYNSFITKDGEIVDIDIYNNNQNIVVIPDIKDYTYINNVIDYVIQSASPTDNTPILLQIKTVLFKQKRFDLINICEYGFFHNKQIAALEKLTDNITIEIGYGGSAFSGKTYLLCYWVLLMSFAYPDTRYALARKELKNLRSTTLQTLFKVLNENNLNAIVHYVYNQQDHVIKFNNLSFIKLEAVTFKPSDPKYTYLGGLEITGAAFDQTDETLESDVKMLYTRCNRWNNKKYNIEAKMFETFNPVKNHVYRRYYKPDGNRAESNHWSFIKALPADNPAPAVKDYVENLIKTQPKEEIERLVYGNFEYDNDPYKLCEYDNIVNMFSNEYVEPDLNDKRLIADIAMEADNFVILVAYGKVIIDIIIKQKTDGKKNVEMILDTAKRYEIPQSKILYDAVGVGEYIKGYIPNAVSFKSNNKAIKTRIDPDKYYNLRTQCAIKLGKMVNNNELYIKAELKDTVVSRIISELEVMKRLPVKDGMIELMRKPDIKPLLNGKSPDIMDVFIMYSYFDVRPKIVSI